eukprot:scaffold248393_cov85-Cyclotella_meneghiniana.AAC.1
MAPSGSANSLNLSNNGSTSCNATMALLQSSTYARMKPSVPLLSSPLIPNSSRCDARLFSKSCNSVSISLRTMAANIGEKGHPCENPSPGSAYNASANGDRDGYLFRMSCSSFSREMLLNMFLMSKDTRERVGRELLACGIVIYFSTPFRIVEMTMSQPPCTPTAKL